MVAVASLAGVIVSIIPAFAQAGKFDSNLLKQNADGTCAIELVSVAHEEGSLHSFAAMLGNDVAIKAYREGKLPYPDGSFIAARLWCVPSAENNKVFGRVQSYVLTAHKHSVRDQGLEKVRGDRRLGVREFHPRWQARQRRVNEDLRSLPRDGFPRFCLHAVRTLVDLLLIFPKRERIVMQDG